MLASFVVGAAASNGLQTITAYLNPNINIKLDGETQILTNANGTRVYPISYNGTTYIPIRAVANLLGIEVDWDQATQTVLLGKTKGVNMLDTYKAYHFSGDSPWSWGAHIQTADGKTESISGIDCTCWVELAYQFKTDGTIASASFNLGGKHDSLTFSYYSDKDITLTVRGDNGSVLFEKEIPGGQVAQTVTIPLFKTSELTFEASKQEWDANVKIFNAYLDKD